MLILLAPAPENCPPQTVQFVESTLRFKRTYPNEPFTKTADKNQQIKDVLGKPMTCEGGWISPHQEATYCAAISDLHKHHGHDSGYSEECAACNNEEDRWKGCWHHPGRPNLLRAGNPTKSVIYRSTRTACQDNGYKEKGSCQFLPSDLRKMQRYLLSGFKLLNIQMWTIILFATLLFLRHDEFNNVEGGHFLSELFFIPMDLLRVDELVVKVWGKCDTGWVFLKLIADYEYPDLCIVRLLLVYLYLLKWKGGTIFPSEEEINNPPPDGIYTTKICYAKGMKFVQDLIDVLMDGRKMKGGMQSWRKTGYGIAEFGGGNRDDMKKSARHSPKSTSAPRYSLDAAGHYKTHQLRGHVDNNVRKWTNIRVENAENTKELLRLAGTSFVKMSELPERYVRDMLGIPADHPLAYDPEFIYTTAIKHNPSSSISQEFQDFKNKLHPNQAVELQEIVDRLIVAKSKEHSAETLAATFPLGLPSTHPRPASDGKEPPTKKYRSEIRKNDREDLVGRDQLQGMTTTLDRIKLMIELQKKVPSKNLATTCTPGAKKFIYTCLNPTMMCLEKHCGDSLEVFCGKYPKFLHTRFAVECCNGKGETCGV